MKQCSKCGRMLAIEDFARHSRIKGTRRPDCKECRAGQNADWYKRNQADAAAKRRQYYLDNRDKILERQRSYRKQYDKDNRSRLNESQRRWRFRQYGLTEQAFEALLVWQGGRCAICFRDNRLVVDHDHTTGEVRGLLCDKCNKALGMLEDDAERIASARTYVEGSSHR